MRSFWTPISYAVYALAFCSTIVRGYTAQLFDFEKIQLTSHPLKARFLSQPPVDSDCKAFPGESNWPNETTWSELNTAVNGALLKPIPLASVCYNNTVYNDYSASQCQSVSQAWGTTIDRSEEPIEVNTLVYEGLTCIPPSGRSGLDTHGCTQGGYPVYVVNVTNVAQIQASVDFARRFNVRLVVKNTGHDFTGKSLGGGALSVWTHHLKDIVFYETFVTTGYTGPAFKVGAGVQAREIYKVAYDKGLMVVGGICDSIGIYGGYTQGGGHSMLGSLHGMGADQVLEIQVVTADGKFLSASPSENIDLFWAIRGGGGSTFGIVTSMVVKAFKDVETTVGTLGWSVQQNSISNFTFWKGVSSYFSYFKGFTEQGLSSEWYITQTNGNPSFSIAPFFAPGKTLEQTQSIAAPWLAEMKLLGINITVTWSHFPSYWTALKDVYDPTTVSLGPYFSGYASRIIPSENFDKSKKLDVTVEAIRKTSEAGHMFVGYMYAPTLEAGAPVGPNGNAVHPAWREALVFTIVFVQWPANATAEEQLRIREEFAIEGMKPIRDVTPGAGSYMNEGDRLEPNFQQAFYGANYEELLSIKMKFDPDDVFWAATAVGSEGWAVRSFDGLPNENGPLCRVTE